MIYDVAISGDAETFHTTLHVLTIVLLSYVVQHIVRRDR